VCVDVNQISDFGLSRESQEDTYYVSKGGALPVRWTAPEVMPLRTHNRSSERKEPCS
jgi:hypothetical protein